MKERHWKRIEVNFLAVALIFSLLGYLLPIVLAVPTGPNTINVTANETKSTTNGVIVNVSGGRIATLNVTATVQNPHWKAFVGDINGRFTLDDATGWTIYDWALASVTGEVYATRTSGSVTWGSITCANFTHMTSEDVTLFQTSSDNITTTFGTNNSQTYVISGTTIVPNSCKAINTYINNATQSTDFEEITIYDGTNLVYVTEVENNLQGFDGGNYDFQMIVPENASQLWTSSTAYYIYVEIS